LSIKKAKFLKFLTAKMRKETNLQMLTLTRKPNRSGTLSISIPSRIRISQKKERRMMEEDFITRDHSTLSQKCGWEESFPSLVARTLLFRLETMLSPNNGLTIKYPRPLDQFNSEILQWMLETPMPMHTNLHLFGIKCSNTTTDI